MPDALEQGLPRAVAVAWGMAADPQRGPKRELSHERIVEAAIHLADAEGLAAVTMSKVATSLGFTTMSLYRYVTSKDELLQLMADAVADFPLPAEVPDDWRAGLRQWAHLVLGAYLDHGWFLELPISTEQLAMPGNIAVADHALRAMRSLPADEAEKIGVLMLLSGYVRAYGMMVHDLGSGTPPPPDALDPIATLLREVVTAERFPDLSPLVAHGSYLSSEGGPEVDDFSFGLDRILDGVAALVADRAAPPSPEAEPGADPHDPALAELPPETAEAIRKDKAVRETNRLRRQAEIKLREAQKAEREAIRRARERAAKG